MAVLRRVVGERGLGSGWAVLLYVFVYLVVGPGPALAAFVWTGAPDVGAGVLGVGFPLSITLWRVILLRLLRERNRPDPEPDPAPEPW
jgi:hypothetical protein